MRSDAIADFQLPIADLAFGFWFLTRRVERWIDVKS
jgi:hypothetical protein